MAVTQKLNKFLKKAFDEAIKLAGFSEDKLNAHLVKPNSSNLNLGDIILFSYKNRFDVPTGWRMALVVRPIILTSPRNNRLLSCVLLPPDFEITPENLKNLYINRATELPEDSYRTFIANSSNMSEVYKLGD